MIFRVGITGGIGTGKTTVAKIFSSFGIPVYNADEHAKWIVNTDVELRKKIVALLGYESYKEKKYNTHFVSQKIFLDKTLLTSLNNIIHPVVLTHFEEWKKNHEHDAPYLIKEASILFESGSYKHLDFIIGIASPKDIRIQRLKQYRNFSDEQITLRMNNQFSEEEKLQRCNAIIYNQPNQLLTPQVWEWHQKIIKKTACI